MTLAPCTVLPMVLPCLEQHETYWYFLPWEPTYQRRCTDPAVKEVLLTEPLHRILKKNVSPYYTCISTAEAVFSFSKQRTTGLTLCGHGCHWIPVFQKQSQWKQQASSAAGLAVPHRKSLAWGSCKACEKKGKAFYLQAEQYLRLHLTMHLIFILTTANARIY